LIKVISEGFKARLKTITSDNCTRAQPLKDGDAPVVLQPIVKYPLPNVSAEAPPETEARVGVLVFK